MTTTAETKQAPPAALPAMGPTRAQLAAVVVPVLVYGALAVGLGVLTLTAGDEAAAERARGLTRVGAPAAFLIALAASVALLIVGERRKP